METKKETLAPIQNLSYILIIGLLALTVVEALSVLTGLWRILSYAFAPEAPVRIVDTVYFFLSSAQGFLFIPIPFAFALWLYRMNYNLRKQTTMKMEFTPGWMVGWYFIPFANLFIPFRSMRELWQVSHKKWKADPSILRWWWGLWLFRGLFDGGSEQVVNGIIVTEQVAFTTMAFVGADILNVALNLVALRIVTSIWAAYEENYIKKVEMSQDSPDIVIHELKEQEKSTA